MKRTILFTFCILTTLILSACGGKATPAVDMTAVQDTAIANAWLAMTQTQAAMPTATATFVPTPLPTATEPFLIVPTLPLLQPTLAPAANPTADPCNEPPPVKPVGNTVQVKFVNKSEGNASLAFGMFQPNAQGECGTYNFYLGRYDAPEVTVLAGCYWAFAYIDTPSNSNNVDALCVYDNSKTVAIWIGKEVINFH